MNIEKLGEKDIKEYLNRERFARLTVEQIIKDLRISGVEVDLDIDNDPNPFRAITEQLKNIVVHYLERDAASLMNLLYRIDLGENTVRKNLLDSDERYDTAEQLTMLIVKRELQKVLYREQFGK